MMVRTRLVELVATSDRTCFNPVPTSFALSSNRIQEIYLRLAAGSTIRRQKALIVYCIQDLYMGKSHQHPTDYLYL